MITINQYDLFLVNLDPTMGSEMKKTRPCVIISPNEMNKHLRTIVIAPITSNSNIYPTRVYIDSKKTKGWVVLDQIRTIDKQRLIKKLTLLNKNEITEIKTVIKETFVD